MVDRRGAELKEKTQCGLVCIYSRPVVTDLEACDNKGLAVYSVREEEEEEGKKLVEWTPVERNIPSRYYPRRPLRLDCIMPAALHAAFKEVSSDLEHQANLRPTRPISVNHELLLRAHIEFIKSKPGIQTFHGTPTLSSGCIEDGSKMIEALLGKGCPARVAVVLSVLTLYDLVVLIGTNPSIQS